MFHSLIREQSHTIESFIRVSDRDNTRAYPAKNYVKIRAGPANDSDGDFIFLICARAVVTNAAKLLVVVVENIDRWFVYSFCWPVYMTTTVEGRNVG